MFTGKILKLDPSKLSMKGVLLYCLISVGHVILGITRMRAWVATRNSKGNLVQEAHMILLVKVILAVMKQLKRLLKLSAKFDSPVEHQNVSLLATAHDCETCLLQPMRGSSSQSSLLMLSGGLSVVLQASHLFQSTLYVVYCLA